MLRNENHGSKRSISSKDLKIVFLVMWVPFFVSFGPLSILLFHFSLVYGMIQGVAIATVVAVVFTIYSFYVAGKKHLRHA